MITGRCDVCRERNATVIISNEVIKVSYCDECKPRAAIGMTRLAERLLADSDSGRGEGDT